MRARTLAMFTTAVVAAGLLSACSSEEDPEATLERFFAGWPTGTWEAVTFVDPAGSPVAPAAVADGIAELTGELHQTPPTFVIGETSMTNHTAQVPVQVQWPLADSDDAPVWTFDNTVRLTEGDDGWQVIWEPAVVHPQLQAGDALVVHRTPAVRGEILDRDGDPLMRARRVVDVGIWPAQATDLDGDLTVLDNALRSIDVQVDRDALAERVAEADPDQFVPVVTLRWDDYEPIREQIRDLGATTFRERERHLAPTATFARALLGVVDEVTAEIIEDNPGVYQVGDQAGHSGLSRAYDEQLRGTAGSQVLIARTTPDDELTHIELHSVAPTAGTDLHLTIDRAVQTAAEQALHGDERAAALVAIRVSDGAVLAVANTRGSAANPVNLAFTASVPPGSTFKLVSAYGLLTGGDLELDTPVPCPESVTVDGYTITNDFGGDQGEIPFRQAVAISCNTAFATLATRLGDAGLAQAGYALGIGADWHLPPEVFTGEVSTGGGATERAAAAFGQGTTVVSPAAMAAAAAAIAGGRWLPPTLVADPDEPAPTAVPLDVHAVTGLQEAARAVVTEGTATALRTVPGEPVHGKTGSAEAGEATHGWFIGWQGDLALAVFVEDGAAGSASAVPLAAEFLRTLHAEN